MKNGMYDEIISKDISEKIFLLDNASLIKSDVNEEDINNRLYELAKEKINSYTIEEKIKILKEELEIENNNIVEKLEGIKSSEYEILYPITKFDNNFLFTGSMEEPTLMEEFKKELKTTDEFLLLVSFIKKSGIAPLIDSLIKFTNRGGKLKIITTTYTKASDFDAIVQVAKLENTEIKISYDNTRTRLHAKSYLFLRNTDLNSAYIGSSNFSHPAMNRGLEWNVKITSKTSNDVLVKFHNTFSKYWDDELFETFDVNNNDHLEKLKNELNKDNNSQDGTLINNSNVQPYDYQRNILLQLEEERKNGNFRNLVVAATGTGKTMIAAFDFKNYLSKNSNASLLFVVHRDEILFNSLNAFRSILNDQNFGTKYEGKKHQKSLKNLFINIASLKSLDSELLSNYDYIIIDEVHHVAAKSYKPILNLDPKILLGLTATPFRGDEKDILKYFNNKASAELNLIDSINNKLISPFNYFGVSDSVDYRDIEMKGTKYDTNELEEVLINKDRINVIVNAIKKYTILDEVKGLGFCCTVKHAEFMADSFNKIGIKSFALTGKSDKIVRNKIQQELTNGNFTFIFTVDLYNEGVDIPEVNTVLFLRPTESPVVFTQQLGRGLRLHHKKDVLTVIDFIGNANKKYSFLNKFRILLPSGNIVKQIEKETLIKPLGCEIVLEEKAREYILENITKFNINKKYFSELYEEGISLNDYFIENNINIEQFYKSTCLTEIRLKEEIKYGAIIQILKTTDVELIRFMKNVIENNISFEKLSTYDKRLYYMTFYTLFTNKQDFSLEYINEFKRNNEQLIFEIIELINYRLKTLPNVNGEKPFEEVPLKIGNKYTKFQVKAALGRPKQTTTSGIDTVDEYESYLLYVTLNKSERFVKNNHDYEDEIISSHKMKWITDSEKETKREVKIVNGEYSNLMFIRDDEDGLYLKNDSFYYVGKAKFLEREIRENRENKILFEFDNTLPTHFTNNL